MSTAATVPMVAPDGTTGDIPHDRVPDAIKSGFKLGAELTAPSGQVGVVPVDRVHEAIGAGFMLKPPGMPAAPVPAGLQKDAPDPNAEDLKAMVTDAAKTMGRVTAPSMAYEALRKHAPNLKLPEGLGMPTPEEVLTTGGLMMLPGGEVEAGAEAGAARVAPAEAAARPAASAAPSIAEGLAGKLLRRVPYLGKVIKFSDLIGDLTDVLSPKTELPPTAKPPAAPVPETNGIPWGTKGPGPLDLRGKMIPAAEAPPSPAETPAAAPAPYRIGPGQIPTEDVNAPNARVLAGNKGVITTQAPSRGLALPAAPVEAAPAAPSVSPEAQEVSRKFIAGEYKDLPDRGLSKLAESRGVTVEQVQAEHQAALEQTTERQAVSGAPAMQGDAVLRKVLTGQDNKNLLQIARWRGINITKEAQLKPGIADNQIINKIIDDFSPDELQNVRDTNIEVRRNMHNFGDIGPEAWKTMGLKTYFPDLKVPQSVLNRTAQAISDSYGSPARPMELLEGHKAFKQGGQWFIKGGNFPAEQWTRVGDKNTASILDAIGARPKATSEVSEDLTGVLQDSLDQARSRKAAQ